MGQQQVVTMQAFSHKGGTIKITEKSKAAGKAAKMTEGAEKEGKEGARKEGKKEAGNKKEGKKRESAKESKSSAKQGGGAPTYYCSVSQKMWCKVETAEKAGEKFALHYDCAGKKGGEAPSYYCSVSQKMWCKVETAKKA